MYFGHMPEGGPGPIIDVFMLPPDATLPPERLRIGQCTVDVSSREVLAPGARRPFRVTPKAMAVLRVLVENGDKVVSRDTLLTTVWPDTLPSDDVLTQAVTQLRKAFHEVRGDPQYIETIAKGGYRLLAAVESLDEPAPAPAEPVAVPVDAAGATPDIRTPVPTGGSAVGRFPETAPDTSSAAPEAPVRRPGRYIVAAIVVVALAVLGIWWLDDRRASPAVPGADTTTAVATQRIEPFLITSAPGFELAPTLSPSGELVAYMAVPDGQRNIAIMLQTTAPVAPRQLTWPEGMAEDAAPRWSPDGRDLAFRRVTPGVDCRLMVIRATGRAERTVDRCDPANLPSYDWTPDGSGLILGGGATAGLQVLDLATGGTRAIQYTADPDHRDTSPRYSSDGRWIVFLRNAPLGDFWRIPAAGGKAERLTRLGTEFLGWDWLPDSSGLVYASRTDGVSRLYRFDIATGIHTALGIDDGEQPAMARNTPALAYVLRLPRFGIYRFQAAGGGEGARLFASSGRDRVPSIAPDGRQLAFVSDRAGPFGLWWADTEQPGSMHLLDGLRPDTRQPAAWSSDSKRLLLIGRQEREGAEADNGVFEVTPDSGRFTRLGLPVADPVQAAYVPGPNGPDQRLLVLAGRDDGRLRLNLFADAAQPGEPVASLDDVIRFQVDAPRQRVVFARLADPGLWQIDLDLDPSSIRPIALEDGVTRWYHAWSVAEDGGIYLVRRTPGCPALLVHDRSSIDTHVEVARPDARTLCLDSERRAATRAFTVNPRTGRLYITLAEYDGGDIGFVSFGDAGSAAVSR